MNEIPEIGIITTKSISLTPKEGNREPIIAKYAPRSFINAVGLANPGVDEFIAKISKINIPKDKFLLVSIFGNKVEDFEQLAKKLYKYADGFELNISCPHSSLYGQVVGQDMSLVTKIVKTVSDFGKPTLVKVSPSLKIKDTVKHALLGGAAGFVAINTKGPEPFTFDNHPILYNKVGGISGKFIKKLGLKCIREIRKYSSLPIIACGGIFNSPDLLAYQKAGANYFGIGSALALMDSNTLKKYFHTLLLDFQKNTNNANKLIAKKLNMDYKKFKIVENQKLTSDVYYLKLNKKFILKPGQFIFAWLPDKGEKPFSLFDNKPASLLIRERGCFTKELIKLKSGDTLYLRGPLGNSPKTKGKILLYGGGCGIAALFLFAKKYKNTIALFGARNKDHLTYLNKFNKYCKKIVIATDDGSFGHHGFAQDLLEDLIKREKPTTIINCGPEIMMENAIKIEKKYLKPENILSSIEYLTKCGIGICGRCATKKGYRSCVDGTFLTPDQI